MERRTGVLSDGVRCLLEQSGLPHGWWPYAARAFAHGMNIKVDDEGNSPWARKHGESWAGPNHVFGMQVHFRKPSVFRDQRKFTNRGSDGIFVGWHLQPGGVYRGDMLVIDVDELAEAPSGTKPRVYRVKEVRVPAIGATFPLRVAQLEARQRMLVDKVEFVDDPEAPEDIGEEEEDEAEVQGDEEPPSGSTDLVRIPRGSRIYIPRVGPRPTPRVPPLNDDLAIEFDQDNPKRAGSQSYQLYELYKSARSVGEARRLGASTGHVRYDIKKGYARVESPAAVVIFGAAAAPLVEAWCDPESPLGSTGEARGRHVFRFTEQENLTDPATVREIGRAHV